MHKRIHSLTRTVSKKGPFFFLNVLVLFLLLWLILPLFDHISSKAWILGRYSPAYFAYLIMLLVPTLVIGYLTIRGSSTTNRNLSMVLFGAFVVGELLTRSSFVASPYRADEQYRFPRPFVHFTGKPNSHGFNELGLKGPVPSKPKGNEFRIIMLGGSTVAVGDPSIAEHLEYLLRQDGYGDVTIYNWGVIAFSSGQELSLLVHTVSDYQPDLVIVYDGGNDVSHPFYHDPRPGYPYNWLLHEAALSLFGPSNRPGQAVGSLLARSKLISTVFRKSLVEKITEIESIREEVGYGKSPWEREIGAAYLKNINKMCSVAQGFGFKIAVFLQPMIHFKSRLQGKEDRLTGSKEFQRHVENCYGYIREEVRKVSPEYGSEHQCFLFDVSEVFSEHDEELFSDYIHISNDGNRIVAKQICRHLKEVGILERDIVDREGR